MRALFFCLLSLLVSWSAAQRQSPGTNASDKARRLEKLAASSSDHLIKLTTTTFDEYTSGQRDYSLSVLLTALSPQFKCGPCVEFNPLHQTLARQWYKSARQPEEKHYFAVLDFPDGQDVFRRMQLNTAPIAKYFPPNVGTNASPKTEPEHYDFRMGASPEEYARWILTYKKGAAFSYTAPVRWDKIFSTVSVTTLIVVVLWKNWNLVGPLLTGRYIWAFGSISVILLMTSGHMWNRIRNPPYLTPQGFIAGGYSNQFGVETHIIAGLYGMLALTVYTIFATLPSIKNPQYQRLGVYVWIGLLLLLHSVLINIFRIKNPGYPFKMFL